VLVKKKCIKLARPEKAIIIGSDIPLPLLSGKIVSELIQNDYRI